MDRGRLAPPRQRPTQLLVQAQAADGLDQQHGAGVGDHSGTGGINPDAR